MSFSLIPQIYAQHARECITSSLNVLPDFIRQKSGYPSHSCRQRIAILERAKSHPVVLICLNTQYSLLYRVCPLS
jgi:hypothetical protein